MRIDGFRDPKEFKMAIDEWVTTFKQCEPTDPSQPVLIPGELEWSATQNREKHGVPVKLAVAADMVEISRSTGVKLPFDEKDVNLTGVSRVLVDRA